MEDMKIFEKSSKIISKIIIFRLLKFYRKNIYNYTKKDRRWVVLYFPNKRIRLMKLSQFVATRKLIK